MKLNLGAGDAPLAGYENWDLGYAGDPSCQHDTWFRKATVYPMPVLLEGLCEEIRASHILEHFSHRETFAVLTDWVRCLAPGGLLKIAVPDFRKIIAAYEARDPLAEAYCYGGQTDERDYHKAGFDEGSLRASFEALGLVDIRPWSDGAEDCSSLPVSLNLCGRKPGGEFQECPECAAKPGAPVLCERCLERRAAVYAEPEPKADEPAIEARVDLTGIIAVMTCPRVGFTDCAHAQYAAFGALGIPLLKTGGVFWDQGISRVIEQAREAKARYVITIDYDSLFTADDVVRLLWTMDQHPEVHALAALEMRRETDSPLFRTGKVRSETGETEEVELSYSGLLENDTLPVATAHLGLTVFRTEAFDRLEKPWFLAVPDAEGGWGEGRMDSDIAFWHRWKEAGNSLHIALRVPIGHLEQVVTWPDAGMQRRMQGMIDWNATGKPDWAWR